MAAKLRMATRVSRCSIPLPERYLRATPRSYRDATIDRRSSYENFLLVISYWIGPWLGVVFADWYARRGHRVDGFLFDRQHRPYAGWLAMLVGIVISVWLFADQTLYTGVVPSAVPEFGDIAFFVGFLIAAALYLGLFQAQRGREPEDAVLVEPGAVPAP